MRALLLGMGNPILGDDGVGLVAAQKMEGRIKGLDVAASPMAGLQLLDILEGCDVLFVCDALLCHNEAPGTLRLIPSGNGARHLFSSHGMNIFNLLELARALGKSASQLGMIYGIVIPPEVFFGKRLSPGLEKELPGIMSTMESDIRKRLSTLTGGRGLPGGKKDTRISHVCGRAFQAG